MRASKFLSPAEIKVNRIYVSSKDGRRYSLTKVANRVYAVNKVTMSDTMAVHTVELVYKDLGNARKYFYENFGGFYRYA